MLTKQGLFLLIAAGLSALIIIALCSIILTCGGRKAAPEQKAEIHLAEEHPLITEESVINEEESAGQTKESSVSHESYQQYSLPSLAGLSGRHTGMGVYVSEIDPVNYVNPDINVLRQMGTDQFIISYFAGEQFYREGSFDKALAEYTTSINRNGEFIEAYISRGNTWVKMREYRRAIEDYNKAIRIDSGRAELFNYRGFARTGLAAGNSQASRRELNLAIEDFTRAIAINRNYVDALINRSHAYFQTGNYDKVIEDCDLILRLEPSNAVIWNRRGSAWYAKEDDDKAIRDFSEAIRLNPNYDVAWYNRGNAWYSKGEPDKALADINRCIALNPSFSAAHASRENILRMQRNAY